MKSLRHTYQQLSALNLKIYEGEERLSKLRQLIHDDEEGGKELDVLVRAHNTLCSRLRVLHQSRKLLIRKLSRQEVDLAKHMCIEPGWIQRGGESAQVCLYRLRSTLYTREGKGAVDAQLSKIHERGHVRSLRKQVPNSKSS